MVTLRTVTWIFWLAAVLGHHQLRAEAESGKQRLKNGLLTMVLLYGLAAMSAIDLGRGAGVWGLAAVVLLADAVISFSFNWLDQFTHVSRSRGGARKDRPGLYIAKELLRLAAILLIAELWPFINPPVTGAPEWLREILRWALLLAVITKPANTLFKRLFARFQMGPIRAGDEEKELPPPVEGAGAVIGSLERIITAILFTLGQFGTVAVIYTAKSIARFDRISKDQAFAEYYLIGTLFSILYVLVAWILLMMFLT